LFALIGFPHTEYLPARRARRVADDDHPIAQHAEVARRLAQRQLGKAAKRAETSTWAMADINEGTFRYGCNVRWRTDNSRDAF